MIILKALAKKEKKKRKMHEIFKQMSKDIEVGKDGNMVETDR